MILVSVLDKKAEAFGPVFTSRNTAIATRDFSQACNDKQSNINKFPEDYCLVLLGEFNEEKGIITPLKKGNKILCEATQFVITED